LQGLFILFARLGLLNNYLGMIFVYVSVSIPFSIYLLVGYLEAVPRSLDEAAILDGCSQFQVIWRIVFPIMLPGVVATATYAFLLCWSQGRCPQLSRDFECAGFAADLDSTDERKLNRDVGARTISVERNLRRYHLN
jgi:hypothetical protein